MEDPICQTEMQKVAWLLKQYAKICLILMELVFR